MECLMDHIVINVEDIEEMIDFYSNILSLETERFEEYKKGEVPFPSVRLNPDTVIDLFPKNMWKKNSTPDKGYNNMNHLCIALIHDQWQKLQERLKDHNVGIEEGPVNRWGSHGTGISIYFRDPENNLIEARHYKESNNAGKCLYGS